MTLITSRQNPKVKLIRSLENRKNRSAQGLFVVEGIRHVGEAVESGAELDFVFYAPDLLSSEFAYQLITRLEIEGVSVFQTTSEIFADLAGKDHPQGILAVVKKNLSPLSTLNGENCSFGVAIESPQDPGNLGTILRTLDAAGADARKVFPEFLQGLCQVSAQALVIDCHHCTASLFAYTCKQKRPTPYCLIGRFWRWPTRRLARSCVKNLPSALST